MKNLQIFIGLAFAFLTILNDIIYHIYHSAVLTAVAQLHTEYVMQANLIFHLMFRGQSDSKFKKYNNILTKVRL